MLFLYHNQVAEHANDGGVGEDITESHLLSRTEVGLSSGIAEGSKWSLTRTTTTPKSISDGPRSMSNIGIKFALGCG